MRSLSRPSALALYEAALLGEDGGELEPLHAVGDDGSRRPVPLRRWLRRPGRGEEELLARVEGPVLDIGCGAGRHVVALRQRGMEAVGVEVSPRAAALARERGARVVEGSIFEVDLPARWASALLLDGNIGIGGDPRALLRTVADLLRPGGSVLVELEPPRTCSTLRHVRLEAARQRSAWIPWSVVAADEIEAISLAAGMRPEEEWSAENRWFARLREAGSR